MSQYDHIHDQPEHREVCIKCGEYFTWSETGEMYPGGKDTEYINCPYCGEKNGSIRTSGFVFTNKID